jgi:exonuclease III
MNEQINIINELDKTNNFNTVSCSVGDLQKHLPPKKSSFTLVTQNIRSIHKRSNIDDTDINLTMLDQSIDFITLTECRICPGKPLPCKDNYFTYSTTKKTNQNDGVVVFVKKNTKHSVKEISLYGASCLEVTTPFFIMICIYRTHFEKNPEKFIYSLDLYLNSPHLKNKVILTGDININILDEQQNNGSSDIYLNMLASHSLEPGHRLNTRIRSCLDHTFISTELVKNFSFTVAVLDTTITDHKMVFSAIYSKTKPASSTPPKQKSIVNYSAALKSLQSEDLSDFNIIKDPNLFTDKLTALITDCLNKNTNNVYIPRNKRIIKPWITEGILRCIKNRNSLQKQTRNDPTNEILKISYRRYRNFCNNLIKK